MRSIFLSSLLLIVFSVAGIGQQRLTIAPEFPKAGEKVTITYNPSVPGATISDTATKVEMVYTYSNFYEMAWRRPMTKINGEWQTSFTIPRYGVFATFYLQSGQQTDQPAPDKHYQLVVYDRNNKRVKSSYLYEAYSLSAQSKAPGLAQRQAALYKEELKNYPDNYEAKLRLISNQMATAKGEEKATLLKKGEEIVAGKFREKPGNMGYMNSTTMGYLIIGENSRLDSIRQVVKQKYPYTEAGYELIIDDIKDEEDTVKMLKGLLALLKKEQPKNATYLKAAHAHLFEYYASVKDSTKALYHLKKLGKDDSPYQPKTLKEQAETLYKNNIALNKAMELARQSLALADTFPMGIIRYFPETGYLPSYHSSSERDANTKKVKGNLYSLMSLIALQQGNKKEAALNMEKALTYSRDEETLANAGEYYNKEQQFKNAFESYYSIAQDHPEDSINHQKMKASYIGWKQSESGFDVTMLKLKAYWNEKMKSELQKEIKSIPSPDFLQYITDLQGKPVSLDIAKNKIVVLDFWATWCVPCMHEMPYLQKAYNNIKNDTNVVFMVINSGAKNTLEDAKNWWGNRQFSFPVFYNTNPDIGNQLGFDLIPATYIIDAGNVIRFKTIGFEGPVIERKIPAAIELLKAQSKTNG